MQNLAFFSCFSSVKFLADLTNVTVTRTKYKLLSDAMAAFQAIHDDWELNICQRYPHDPLIGGMYIPYNIIHVTLNWP
jgi:hypothetical protein